MLSIAMTVFVLGFILGFFSYWVCRVGYKELIKMLDEEKNAKKEPLAYSDQLD